MSVLNLGLIQANNLSIELSPRHVRLRPGVCRGDDREHAVHGPAHAALCRLLRHGSARLVGEHLAQVHPAAGVEPGTVLGVQGIAGTVLSMTKA